MRTDGCEPHKCDMLGRLETNSFSYFHETRFLLITKAEPVTTHKLCRLCVRKYMWWLDTLLKAAVLFVLSLHHFAF